MIDRAQRVRLGRRIVVLALGWMLATCVLPASALATCVPEAETLCLRDGRFAVEVDWRDFKGRQGTGKAEVLSHDAGYFWFFRAANVELMVKVLDGQRVNGNFWVFAGALSTVEYTLRVTDTQTGARREYFNPLKQLSSFADTHAFPASGSAAGARTVVLAGGVGVPLDLGLPEPWAEPHEQSTSSACVADAESLCLLGGRFRVAVTWRNRQGKTGHGKARDLTGEAGYFWFFREANIELVVKMVDGRPSNGSYWLFWGALSNVEYHISVTDMFSGRTVEYTNPLNQLASGVDVELFTPSAHPPAAPVITEPAVDGQQVSPFDVHMETSEIADADPGDEHYCSDFEIWALDGAGALAERVWMAPCVTGPEKTHTHLGDGLYLGSLADRQALLPVTTYLLRVRHYDSTGAAGAWGERRLLTRPQTAVVSLELTDVASQPAPRWQDGAGVPVVLPAGGASSLSLEAPAGAQLLLAIAGLDGTVNQVTNPLPLAAHVEPRLRLSAGGAGLELPETDLVLSDGSGEVHTLYLPAVDLGPGEELLLWVSSNGSTYLAQAGQQQPRFTTLARSSPLPWQLVQPGYELEVVAEDFQLPVNIAFVPDPGEEAQAPWFYVTELYGTIKTVLRDGTVLDYATGLLNFNPTGAFPGSGEMGITGTVVEPATGDLLVAGVYSPNPQSANPTFYPRVIRLHSADGGRTAASQQTVLDLFGTVMSPSHQISNLSFGPDGMLYVHVGDGVQRERAQDLHSYLGKILRLTPAGQPPADNPFYDPQDGVTAADYIYALGFRNPFGGAWRVADGELYEVENGPSRDRFAKVTRGGNYSWGLPADSENELMLTGAIYNWEPSHAPVNVVFLQEETFGGSGFPASRMDHAFVSESGATWAPGPSSRGKRIVEFILDGDGVLVSGPIPVVEYNGAGRASVVALAAGPDGLYFSDFYRDIPTLPAPAGAIERGSRVLRIRYVGAD